jgi:hypothetical protein
MPSVKEGDKVRVSLEKASSEDMELHSLFGHMDGLTGVVENHYSPTEIAVKVDIDSLGKVPGKIHTEATKRMRRKFSDAISEEQKKHLTREEMQFVPHYVILVREADLQKI